MAPPGDEGERPEKRRAAEGTRTLDLLHGKPRRKRCVWTRFDANWLHLATFPAGLEGGVSDACWTGCEGVWATIGPEGLQNWILSAAIGGCGSRRGFRRVGWLSMGVMNGGSCRLAKVRLCGRI